MKKKKKTLYIRKVRINLKKKKTISPFKAESFLRNFNHIFRRKINILKKKNFVKFLNKFESTNFDKVFNFIKCFGMKKSYRFFNFKYKSKLSKFLFLKFKKKKAKNILLKFKRKKLYNKKIKKSAFRKKKYINKDKKKDIDILKLRFVFFFSQKVNFRRMRMKNIKFKEKLCLYFSYRHMMYLPVRGQRTKTNAKTRKDFNV